MNDTVTYLQQTSEAHTPRLNGKPIITCDCGSDEVQMYSTGDATKIECITCKAVLFYGSDEGATDFILAQIKRNRENSC